MKKIDSIRELIEVVTRKQHMSQEYSKLILKAQASLKEYVLNGICTYCEKKVDHQLFKNDSEKHDYHSHGMCKKCIELMLLEPNRDLKWLN
jgi:hypothetical protein